MNALSLGEVELVANLWNSGASISEIVEKTGRTKNSIHHIRRMHDDLFENRRAAIETEAMIEKAARLWNSGLKLPALADELGIGVHQLRGVMTRNAARFAERDLRHSAWRQTLAPAAAAAGVSRRNPKGRAEFEPGLADLHRSAKPAVSDSLLPLSLLDLTERSCRWPISGEGAATRFCGHCIPIGKIYCEAHRARSRESGR
jgi:hypothetical protein